MRIIETFENDIDLADYENWIDPADPAYGWLTDDLSDLALEIYGHEPAREEMRTALEGIARQYRIGKYKTRRRVVRRNAKVIDMAEFRARKRAARLTG
jgi:hypothetical protein